jgi:hypothetical protein
LRRALGAIVRPRLDHGTRGRRTTVSPRNNLKTNPNGSTTLYFQTESPGKDEESNRPPATKGEFIPIKQMYGPQQRYPSVLDGTWTPPAVEKAS